MVLIKNKRRKVNICRRESFIRLKVTKNPCGKYINDVSLKQKSL